jgi:hypothetical protein
MTAHLGSVFDGLFGFGSWPEPPDIVPLRILGLTGRPASQDAVRSAFRARLLLVHPDVAAYSAVPELQRAADAIAAQRPEVAELVWARDVLLRKIPAVTDINSHAGNSAPVTPLKPQECKGCGGIHVTNDGGTVYGFHDEGRWRNYCWPCAEHAENARQRDLRRERRADRACDSCGETFTPPRSDGRYCSPACRQRAYRERQATP